VSAEFPDNRVPVTFGMFLASEPITSPLVDLLRQYKLLQEEFEFEKETFYQQTQRAGIPKRIQQGVCWYPVSQVSRSVKTEKANRTTVFEIVIRVVILISFDLYDELV